MKYLVFLLISLFVYSYFIRSLSAEQKFIEKIVSLDIAKSKLNHKYTGYILNVSEKHLTKYNKYLRLINQLFIKNNQNVLIYKLPDEVMVSDYEVIFKNKLDRAPFITYFYRGKVTEKNMELRFIDKNTIDIVRNFIFDDVKEEVV